MHENGEMNMLKVFQSWGWGIKENDGRGEFNCDIL
jgi:hypothetical protein